MQSCLFVYTFLKDVVLCFIDIYINYTRSTVATTQQRKIELIETRSVCLCMFFFFNCISICWIEFRTLSFIVLSLKYERFYASKQNMVLSERARASHIGLYDKAKKNYSYTFITHLLYTLYAFTSENVFCRML